MRERGSGPLRWQEMLLPVEVFPEDEVERFLWREEVVMSEVPLSRPPVPIMVSSSSSATSPSGVSNSVLLMMKSEERRLALKDI